MHDGRAARFRKVEHEAERQQQTGQSGGDVRRGRQAQRQRQQTAAIAVDAPRHPRFYGAGEKIQVQRKQIFIF